MKLALFDLDNTLLPIDSDHGWSQFLINIGVLKRDEFEARNNDFYEQYKAGVLDIYEFLSFQLQPLKSNSRQQLDQWHAQFMEQVIKPQIKPSALNLVWTHQAAGDVCMVITATNRFITEPIVKAFGITELIATELEIRNGEFTGEVKGEPSFREGKVKRIDQWLADREQTWDTYEQITFYSDSINDLPLLERATHPVAANPDDTLRNIALERGWQVLELFK
ncbi:MAG: HAD family hydrolase [Limnobacter sp.]|nr:HAD family hydrolase [Limnobacter sp.]